MRGKLRRAIVILETIAAISSVAGGGVALVVKPDGSIMGFEASVLERARLMTF